MLWRAGHQDDKTVLKLVRVNDRVQVRVWNKGYFTRIEDIRSNDICISAPLNKGKLVWLRQGMEILLNIIQVNGLRQFSATVKSIENNRVPMVVLHKFRDKGIVQQRTYLRVCDKLPVRFRREAGNEGWSGWKHSNTIDISGGGLSVAASDAWLLAPGDLVEVDVIMPEESAVRGVAQVVRTGTSLLASKKTEINLAYIQIDEDEQKRLDGFVTRRRAELAKHKTSFVVCDSVDISYRPSGHERWSEACAYDMSREGFRMILKNTAGLEEGIELEAVLAISGQSKVNAVCKLLWIRPAKDNTEGKYKAGVRFRSIRGSGSRIINEFLLKAEEGKHKAA